MKRVNMINFLLVLFIISMYVGMLKYNQKDLKEFESIHLAYAIDLCSDASAFKMTTSDDINADYQDFESIEVNPQIALDTFIDMMCFNYGLYPNEENRKEMMNYIPNFTIAGYDGYWMAQPACIEDTDITIYEMIFTPKLPYKAQEGTDYFALNMGGKTAIKLRGDDLTKTFTRVSVDKLPNKLNDPNMRQSIINKTLTDSIGSAVNSLNAGDNQWKNTFYVPSNLTKYTGVNPVTGPSVLALVQNVDLITGKKASAFSITGAKITTAKPIVAYVKNGVKLYAYADKLNYEDGGTQGVPLFPFLQLNKKTQRFYWWDYPQYKYTACTSSIDWIRLKNDSSYKVPSMNTTNYTNMQINFSDGTNASFKQFYMSKKDAAKDGYMYDATINRKELN